MTEVRRLVAEDEAAFYALARYAFHKPQSETRDRAFASLYAHSAAWAVGTPLQSGLLGTHFEVDLSGVTYKMSGVGYVSSYPEASGHGGISAIMQQAFADMRANGETLSYLAPFSSTFYRRFGYEGAFDQVTHTIAARDLPKVPRVSAAVTVARVPFRAAIEAMAAVYGRSKDATRGGLRRADWWWSNMADHYPNREVAVAMLGERPTGYVIYERDGDTFRILEQFHDDLDALLALARFITAHRTAFAQFVYTTGNPESLHDLLPEPGALTTTVRAYMMARIVDVQDFMQRYPYQVSDLAPVVIAIQDDFLPANAGLWQLAINDGQVTFERATSTATPALRLSIEQLVKVSFGVRTLRDASNLGLIDGDAFTIASVGDAFLQRQTQLYDYF
ncbi:GNAT family N-acetyltransferase [Lacticaseibacillus daqingensis]|uniref:GNAT family N-acetyltransferase n=1 Tax=Lacticaseibacillus daqingensis TaxID=2486014 RepID=UPI000F7B6C2D|nr:GNAT family N-acetyltransferase [Lacticaseibacillus daqingensis]